MSRTRKSNGDGSIYYDEKNSKYYAEIKWTDRNGEKHRKKFSNARKNVVKNKLEEFKRQLLISSGNLSATDVTFEEFATNWLNTTLKYKLKPTSLNRKEVTLVNQVYPHIGNIPINQITHADIQDMVDALYNEGLSYSTIKKAYEAVNGCIRAYRIKSAIPFNPCEGITLPANIQRSVSNIVFFNEEQRILIKEEATRRYGNGKPVYRLGNAIIVLMYTGLRIGELLALTWDDVDFENKTISVDKNAVVVKATPSNKARYEIINQLSTKTKSGRRIIPMSATACIAMREIFNINGDKKHVMSTETGTQNLPRNINRMFHSILTKTGISKGTKDLCGVHALRHTFASMLFQNGCEVKVASEILGHSDTKITENIYIHVIQQQKVKAIQDIDKYSS